MKDEETIVALVEERQYLSNFGVDHLDRIADIDSSICELGQRIFRKVLDDRTYFQKISVSTLFPDMRGVIFHALNPSDFSFEVDNIDPLILKGTYKNGGYITLYC
ncbi:MAG: hypothetical protein J6I84_02675 [Bacilli bacterium]|nr:hypothetical protein [Bacilli bacterium]